MIWERKTASAMDVSLATCKAIIDLNLESRRGNPLLGETSRLPGPLTRDEIDVRTSRILSNQGYSNVEYQKRCPAPWEKPIAGSSDKTEALVRSIRSGKSVDECMSAMGFEKTYIKPY